MAWNTRCWDGIQKLFWKPEYVGLYSFKKNQRVVEKGRNARISVAKKDVQKGGSIYARKRNWNDQRAWLEEREEILNHVFDLTISIAPDQVIRDLFLKPLDIVDAGSFETLGREVRQRYGWKPSANITQQDGLIVSPKTAFGIELKLGASSEPGQVLKYAALLTWEEITHGRRDSLGLLYIVPGQDLGRLWSDCGLLGPHVDGAYLTENLVSEMPQEIQDLIASNRAHVESVLERMRLRAISWAEFHDSICPIVDALDQADPGEQTLHRLLSGFLAQLREQRGAGLDHKFRAAA